jgi:hypothetical protein
MYLHVSIYNSAMIGCGWLLGVAQVGGVYSFGDNNSKTHTGKNESD